MRVCCDKCGLYFHGDYDPEDLEFEVICLDCEQNQAEAAYERMCEDFHDGGSTSWPDAERKRMDEARKLK